MRLRTIALAALCLGLAAGGCGSGRTRSTQLLPLCVAGDPSPVSVQALIRRFASRGIAMRAFRSKRCDDAHTVGQIWNWDLRVSRARQRSTTLLHGAIRCDLYDSSRTETLERLTFAHGRKLIVLTLKNVACTVYPSNQVYLGSPDHHRQQERAVERVMRTLSR